MKLKLLIATIVLMILNSSYGQVYLHDFGTTPISAYPYTVAPTTFDPNLNTSSWTNSTGAWTSFGGSSGQAISLNNSSGTPTITLTFNVATGYQLSISSFDFWRQRSNTGAQNWSMTINGITVGSGTVPTTGAALGATTVSNAVNNLTGTITVVLSLSGASGTGTFRLDDFTLNGTVVSAGITTAQNGPWTTPATWTGGVVPTSAQNVIINHAVTATAGITRNSGTTTIINASGSLSMNGATYTNSGSTTISGGFTITTGGWATGNNFVYSGTSNLLTINSTSNYVINNADVFWPAANSPYNVTVSQSAGITINAGMTRTIAGLFAVGGAVTMPSGALTLNGTTNINSNGFFSAAPIYGAASTLVYNSGGPYGRGFEWSAAGAGTIGVTPGYPNNVQVSNFTSLDYVNTGTPGAVGIKAMAGSLQINSGATLSMNNGTSTGGYLLVAGDVNISGSLILGTAVGDDLRVTGNFNVLSGGSFNGNNRAIYFNKASGTQTVSSVPSLTIPYIVFDSTGNRSVDFGSSTFLTVSAPLGGNAISFGSASDVLSFYNTLTIGTVGSASTISGAGFFKAMSTTTSSLSLPGNGSVGILRFTAGFDVLKDFSMSRTFGTTCATLGSNMTVNGTMNLTGGNFDVANYVLTIPVGATLNAGSSNWVIADRGYGANAALKKGFTAAPTSGSPYLFPIGDAAASINGSEFTPITIFGTGGTYASAYISVAVNDFKHPNFDATSQYLTRYWDIATTGITGGTLKAYAKYTDADVNTPAQEGNYLSNVWNGTSWTNGGSSVDTVNNNAPSASVGGGTPIVAGATNNLTAGLRDQEINIQVAGVNYLTGSTYDFGNVLVGGNNSVTFTIQNTGQQNLTVNTATVVGNPPYIYTAYTNGNILGPLGTKSFTINFMPTAGGTFTGSITIPSNDADENPYTINFTGVGVIPAPEINVKGIVGANPSIVSGDTTPSGTDNTQFAAQTLGNFQTKTFRIENIGSANLNVSSIVLTGGNTGDFSVTASTPYVISFSGTNYIDFTITFAPIATGLRTTTVSISNDDATGGENPYTFVIEGTGNCGTATNTITPTSGPVGTEVTITATANNLTGATVSFNGVSAVVTPVDATHIKAIVPVGAVSGTLTTTNSQGCTASNPFTIINNAATGCQGGNTVSELFITEVTDATSGGLTYVEIYNGTGAAVNLSPYSIRTANNGGAYNAAVVNLNNVSLPNNTTYTVSLGSDSACGVSGGDGSLANQASAISGINFDPGQNDHIALFKSGVIVDSWGTFGSANWADALGLGDRGATFRRKNNVVVPKTTYSNSDWNITDWAGTGAASCSTNDYSDIGTFNFLSGTPPTVTLNPVYTPSCKATALTVAGTEGFAGGNPLAYQWYAVPPNTAAWTALTNSGVYSGVTTATLNISNIAGLDGYQFYCQIRENGATCYTATNAVKISEATTVTWNGTVWTPSVPTANSIAVINGNYDTAVNGNFEACSVTVNGGFTLNIGTANYVLIQNDLTVNSSANLTVQDSGSLVMVDDAGVVTNNGTTQVKRTTSAYNKFDYTYWSAPTLNPTIGTTLPGWRMDYAFYFLTANYADVIAPFDGFDDDQNAWTHVTPATTMTKGKGYAVMSPTGGTFPATNTVTFSGPVNNGVVNILLGASANSASNTDDFNLIGNPYPSAIKADDFINANTNTSGTLYFWTHRTAISSSAPGPDVNNFITADYAMYNLSGGTSSGTGSAQPNGYIGTGEGFFVNALAYTNVVFNNSMRSKTYSNSQFFRMANPGHATQTPAERDRLWLNLESADGLFSQQLIGYFDNTTLDVDRGYDGVVSRTSNTLSFYSFIGNDKYRIQARPPFDVNDRMPLGYSSTMAGAYTIGIGQREGVFNNPDVNIYLEDKLLGIVHDLKQAPYSFSTAIGVFDDRFVLKYIDSALGNDNFESLQQSVVVAVSDAQIKVKSYAQEIRDVAVYDILGRQVFVKEDINANEFFVGNAVLNQQALIVKITLESGVVVTRKIIF